MAVIDDKVVAMSFESSKFEQGVNSSITAIDKLKQSLKFPDAGKGLDNINAAAKRFDLSHIARSVDDIKGRLTALSVAALAIFANIATKAVQAGARFASAFTLDPIKAGFHEYTTNLNAVQTILANTQAAGTKLKDVNEALNTLNEYSDRTIYNFSQMAKNIGTFTAAGVDLDTAVGSIKGIANLAALSGSSAEQASTAMYQLSQAISSGRVSLQDWNSVVNAGMGGTVFQRALAQTAEAMGTLEDGAVKLVGPMKNVTIAGESFRESVSAKPGEVSWLTSKVLTATLEQFTGDLTAAELKAQGFNEAQIKAIQQTAKTAQHAATEVKTLDGVLTTAKETAQSGWAQTWQIVFGDFNEAKKTFTDLSNTINGFISANADARNKVLSDWKALGGRTVMIEAIKNAFEALKQVVAPIKDAFRDIFPAVTGKNLFDLTVRFKEFTETLKPSPQTIDNLRRTFRGLFALLDIGKQIITGIFRTFGRLFDSVGAGQGGFLSFTAKIGDFLVKLDEALKKSDAFQDFFIKLGDVLAVPIKLLQELGNAIADLLTKSGFAGDLAGDFGELAKAASPVQRIMEAISTAWTKLISSFEGGDAGSVIASIAEAFQGLFSGIGHALATMNFETIFSAIRTGLFAGLVLLFKNFFGSGSLVSQLEGLGGGIIKNIAGSFSALEGSMKAMQQNIKAKTLKEIAIAIALLAASVVALSFVDSEELKKSLTAITVMFGQLLGAMAILDKISQSGGFLKLPVIAAGLVILAVAIDLLTIAVFALSKLEWEELLKGLAGVGALLGGISAASIPLSANSAGLIRAGIGITAIAVAMKILASAVEDFAEMSWTEIAKGLSAVAVGLGAITAATRFMPTGMIAMGVALIAISVSLKILADAVAKLGAMSWTTIGRGLAGVGGALTAIATAMRLMPKNLPVTAAGLVLVSLSLNKIADAIIKMGGLSIKTIATGLGTLAGALAILAGALYLMSGTLAGASALTVAAAGIAILVPALTSLGKLSWEQIIKGLVTLAAALTVIGIAGIALAPVVPALLGLGAALVLIGGGLALAGAGIALIGIGLSAIAVAGPAAIGILVAALIELTEALTELVKNVVAALVVLAKELAASAPEFGEALLDIIEALVKVVVQAAPKIAEAFTALIKAALKVIRDNDDKIVKAGVDLILALLKGIKNNIGQVVNVVVDIIVRFVNAVANNVDRIVTAGFNLLKALLKGISDHISNVVGIVTDIIAKFVDALGNTAQTLATAGLKVLTDFLKGIASNIRDAIAAGKDVITAFIEGIGDAAGDIVTSAVETMAKFLDTLATESVKLADAGAEAIIKFLNGIADTIETREPEMIAAGARIGVAIVKGMVNGLVSWAPNVYNKAKEIGGKVIGFLGKAVGLGSPSWMTEEMGEAMIQGLANGLEDDKKATQMAKEIGNGLIQTFKDIFKISSPSKVMHDIGQAVGQGFAEGLRSSADDIKEAFTDLNNKLTDAMVNARETIKSEQEKLNKEQEELAERQAKLSALRAEKEPDKEAIKRALDDISETQARIKEIQAVLTENEDILARTTAGHKLLTKALQDEKEKLIETANEYEKISKKLDDARQALEDIKQARRDLVTATAERFAALPELDITTPEQIAEARKAVADAKSELAELTAAEEKDQEAIVRAQEAVTQAQKDMEKLLEGKVLDKTGLAVDQLKTYEEALKHQTSAIGAYKSTLEQLRKLGLDDATYKKLVDEGTADQAFANQLLAGGRKAVERLNKLDEGLQFVSNNLGKNVGKEMFSAGQKVAEDLVRGLDKDKKAAANKMEEIGQLMVAALKKALGMKSPSKEMIEIAELSIEGLVIGFNKSGGKVVETIENITADALSAMKKTMRELTTSVANEINPNPVITPVLDLSTVRNQTRELSALASTAGNSFRQASIISSTQGTSQTGDVDVAAVGPSVIFEQHNTSPVALSEIEIYRQTRNQLSQLKSVLDLT